MKATGLAAIMVEADPNIARPVVMTEPRLVAKFESIKFKSWENR